MMDLEQFPVNTTAKRMLDYVTGNGFYDNSYVGKWLFQVMGLEMEDARKIVEELPYQAFPETATWGLCYHEQKYGFPSIGTIEERRHRLIKKLRSVLPFCPAMLTKYISELYDIPNDCILIEENIKPYTFRITLSENDNCSITAKSIKDYVIDIKPSHLHLDLMKEYINQYYVDIIYDSMLTIQISFYPRYNVPDLFNNGYALMDGTYYMNGLQSDQLKDFYPMSLMLQSEINAQPCIGHELMVKSDVKHKKAEYNTAAQLNSFINAKSGYDNVIHICSAVSTHASISKSHLTVEKALGYNDGEYYMDGSRCMDTEIIEYEL